MVNLYLCQGKLVAPIIGYAGTMPMPKGKKASEVTEIHSDLGRNLQKLLAWKKISRVRLAVDAGVTRKTVDNVVNAAHDTTLGVVNRLAAEFDLTAWQLLTLHDRESYDLLVTWNKTNETGRKILRVAMRGAREEGGLD